MIFVSAYKAVGDKLSLWVMIASRQGEAIRGCREEVCHVVRTDGARGETGENEPSCLCLNLQACPGRI